MKIGVFVNTLTPRGASQARFQSELLRGLEEFGGDRHEYIVLSHSVPAYMAETKRIRYAEIQTQKANRGVRAVRASVRAMTHPIDSLRMGPARLLSELVNEPPEYYRQLRELDIRLLWNVNQHELPASVPFIRTIWDVNHRIHSMYPEFSYTRFTFDGLDRNLEDSLARASYVVVGTEEGKRQLVEIYGVHAAKVRVIPFPTPKLGGAGTGAQDERAHSHSDPYIFYPARLWPHKNHVVIVEALKILIHEYGLKLRCVFCGADEGNLSYIMKCADRLGVKDHVEYTGSVSDEALTALYRGAAALVFASAVGPDNLPPLEAMSLGCPVITADVPGVREQCGDAALYFPPTNERELATQIRNLLEDHSTRESLISRGMRRAASWTVEDYARSMLAIFDEFSAVARGWERCDSVFT